MNESEILQETSLRVKIHRLISIHIIDCYEQLHSFGAEYLVNDFDEYIRNHQPEPGEISDAMREFLKQNESSG